MLHICFNLKICSDLHNNRHILSKSSTTCNLITIDKDEIMKLSDHFLIFKINVLNLLSARIQKMTRHSWHKHPDDIRSLIIRFIKDHCAYPAGKKR